MANTITVYPGGSTGPASATTTDRVQTFDRAYAAGSTIAFPVRWGYGPASATRVINSVQSTGGETGAPVASSIRAINDIFQQWVVFDRMSASGNRQFTPILDGAVQSGFPIEVPFILEIANTPSSGSVVGGSATDGLPFTSSDQAVTLSPNAAANSTIVFIYTAAGGSTPGTLMSGFTAITVGSTAFTTAGFSDQCLAGYRADAGAAGAKTAGYTGGSGSWCITAIEIKTGAGGIVIPKFLYHLAQQGIA